jgi:hypothetical protein
VAKKLGCTLGRHDWTTRVEGGESYKVCSSCGKLAAVTGEQPGLPGWAPDSGGGGGTLGKPLPTDLRRKNIPRQGNVPSVRKAGSDEEAGMQGGPTRLDDPCRRG